MPCPTVEITPWDVDEPPYVLVCVYETAGHAGRCLLWEASDAEAERRVAAHRRRR